MCAANSRDTCAQYKHDGSVGALAYPRGARCCATSALGSNAPKHHFDGLVFGCQIVDRADVIQTTASNALPRR